MVLMMGGLLISIGLSGLLANSTRAVALGMPVTFFEQPLQIAFCAGQLSQPGGCEWVQLGHCEANFYGFVFMGLTALAEGVDGFTSTHHSGSRLNSIICMTNLQ